MTDPIRDYDNSLAIEQIKFLEAYLLNFDLEAACDTSGLSLEDGNKTLKHPVVKEIVDRERGFRYRRLTVSASKTILAVAEIAYGEPLVANDQLTRDLRKAQLESTPETARLKALEILCKYSETLGCNTKDPDSDDVLDKVSSVEGAKTLMVKIMGK